MTNCVTKLPKNKYNGNRSIGTSDIDFLIESNTHSLFKDVPDASWFVFGHIQIVFFKSAIIRFVYGRFDCCK